MPATLAKHRADVAPCSTTASRYDLMNDVMTMGCTGTGGARWWAIDPRPGDRLGPAADRLQFPTVRGRGALVVPADLGFGMVSEGRAHRPSS